MGDKYDVKICYREYEKQYDRIWEGICERI